MGRLSKEGEDDGVEMHVGFDFVVLLYRRVGKSELKSVDVRLIDR